MMTAPATSGQVEEQLEGERPADDLGQVGGDGHQLGLHPVGQPDRAAVAVRRPGPGSDSPVSQPTLADRYWMSPAIRVAPTSTHSSR